jgi:Outer membrane protein/protective antigen OMA87
LQFPDDTLQIIRIKEDFRPQVNSLIGYTHRVSNTDLIRRDRGRLVEYSLSMGGNLPYLVDRFIATPGELEGTIRSPFSEGTNLDYNQFVKLTADYRRYYSPLPDMVLAWRLFGGFAQPFSARQSVPLNQRFFAGGSNDIRAWPPFRLGPGSIPPDEVTINGGEIKLAAFLESRWLTFTNVLSKRLAHGAVRRCRE